MYNMSDMKYYRYKKSKVIYFNFEGALHRADSVYGPFFCIGAIEEGIALTFGFLKACGLHKEGN